MPFYMADCHKQKLKCIKRILKSVPVFLERGNTSTHLCVKALPEKQLISLHLEQRIHSSAMQSGFYQLDSGLAIQFPTS